MVIIQWLMKFKLKRKMVLNYVETEFYLDEFLSGVRRTSTTFTEITVISESYDELPLKSKTRNNRRCTQT